MQALEIFPDVNVLASAGWMEILAAGYFLYCNCVYGTIVNALTIPHLHGL